MKSGLWKTQNSIKIFCMFLTAISVFGLPLILNPHLGYLGYSNSLLSILLLPLIYMLYYQCVNQITAQENAFDKRRMCYSVAFGGLLAIALITGKGLDEFGELPIKQLGAWIGTLIYTAVFTFLMYSLFCYLDTKTSIEKNSEESSIEKYFPIWEIFLFFAVCYGIVLLAVYPGFFNYDAAEEYNEVAMRIFNTHHPLTHVVMLGGIICGVHKITGSFNLGIFCYTLFQMLIMSGIFTYLIVSMRKWNVNSKARLITLLYLALFPANVMFVLCSAKDTLCAGCMVLTIIELINMQIKNTKKIVNRILLICSLTGAILLRNNVLYAVLVCMCISLIVAIWKKDNRKKSLFYAGIGIVSIGLSLGVNQVLIQTLHADHYENQEMLTVPIQQVARVWKVDSTQFAPEELNVLYQIIPQKALERYTPNLSDPVKYYFDNQAYEQNKQAFWSLWFRGFIRNPIGYVNAWLMTSYGYWYPDTIVNVYEGHNVYTFTYEDSSFFAYETEPPGERSSWIPGIDEFYRKMSLEIAQQKIPGLSMLFSMGFIFWVFAWLAVICLYEKQGRKLIPFIPCALVWLTLLLGPTYLPRYITFLWFALPIMLCIRKIDKATELRD